MAINPETQYPGKIAPSTPDYPYGAARNITSPGDGTGTPWEAALVNDLFGFQQALLTESAIAPSGSPEKATSSQYLGALRKLFGPVIDNTALALTKGLPNTETFHSLGYNTKGDGGGWSWFFTGSVVPGSAGTINIAAGQLYDADGRQFEVLPVNGRVPCTAIGMFPDETTDWRGNGVLDAWLRYLRDHDVTGVFVAGYYRTALDNFYSNVKIYGEPGAIFGGTIHVAINDNIADDTSNRPQNVSWLGECATYQRVGSYNCDNVCVQRMVIREDPARDISGFRGAGVHLYSGTRNMYIGDIYVEASERSYGLGIDFEPTHTTPENIHIDRVYIKKSYVHGVSIVGENIRIDDLVVEEYGAGNITDPGINFGMPNTAASTTNAVGLAVDNSTYPSFGKVQINQVGTPPQGHKGALLYNANIAFDSLVIRDAVNAGFHNVDATVSCNHLDVRVSGDIGIISTGNTTVNSLNSSFNDSEGIQVTAGSFQAHSVNVNTNALKGLSASNCSLFIGRIVASVNNSSVNDYQVELNNVSGNIGTLETSRASSGDGGGVRLIGDLEAFTVNQLTTIRDSDDVTAGGLAALLLDNCTGLTILSFDLQGDDGVNSWQPLRMLTVSDVNLNGGVIEDQFNANGVAAAGLTNIGFMNCNNKTGVTNIAAASVAEFNCQNMTV